MSKLTSKNNNILRSPRKSIMYILFTGYLLLLSMNAALIMTNGEWTVLNILAVISISFGIWYST